MQEPSNQSQFSKSELTRYSRHLILPEVGFDGQRRLKHARVLIVGAGGLGSPASLYLAAAGIGEIGLADHDEVDLSNLQRQILYKTTDVGSQKVSTAATRLQELNNEITITAHAEKLSVSNAMSIIQQYDLVIDGTDNFATRYLINDACVMLNKPNVYGSIFRFEGQVSIFHPPKGPCYRCLYPKAPPPEAVPNCAEGGVLGVLAGTIGVLQATEALKFLLGLGETLVGRLILYDALDMRFDCLNIKPDAQCPICGANPTIKELVEETVSCASDVSSVRATNSLISAGELQKALAAANHELVLLDVRNRQEYELCHLPGALLVPLIELDSRSSTLNPAQDIVVYCKSGMRSERAAELLRAKGFARVRNLEGGILQWAREVDPSMSVY